jgi:hypothetical protein
VRRRPEQVGRGRARHHDPDGATEGGSREVEGRKQPSPFTDARGAGEIGQDAEQDGGDQPPMVAQIARAVGEAGPESGVRGSRPSLLRCSTPCIREMAQARDLIKARGGRG